MDKHSVDFNKLDQTVNSKRVYKLADVSDKIEKVAFDVVRFRDNDDTPELWRIEDSVDGPVIVAMYDEGEKQLTAEASAPTEWNAIADGSDVNIFYKGEALTRIASSSVGVPSDEVSLLCRWLPDKLAADDSFRKVLFKDMSKETRELVFSKYPELKG